MQRLLQGDVGSGKTVVALYALLRAVEARPPGRADGADRDARRAALPHGRGALPRRSASASALLTSSSAEGRSAIAGASILVGTHALIQEGVDLSDLAVAVIDEQHRFGVEQRKALAEGRARTRST